METKSTLFESTDHGSNVSVSVVGKAAWIVLASAFVGWMFDAMDLYLFTMIMVPALHDLLGASQGSVMRIGGFIVGAKLLCWGIGGILFGIVADRFGRARVMLGTMLIYSVFTAAGAFARDWHQLLVFQMLAGFGIGGEWAAGAALVVETWPEKHRAKAIQVMQVANVAGLVAASALAILLSGAGWRWVLGVGAAPAVASLGLRFITPESARWEQSRAAAMRHAGPKMGSISEIFGSQLRRRTIVGTLIASAMMIGGWGASILFPTLLREFFPSAGNAEFTRQTGIAFMATNAGAVLGYASILLLVSLIPRVSRRIVYAVFCAGAWIAVVALFGGSKTLGTFYFAMLGFGFFAMGGFGIVALYLTELFPLHVRATGQGFAWNMARLFTALGPLVVSFASESLGFRVVGITLATVFGMGLAAVFFGPETG
ncbi:MFS transporter [Paraburkholderia sp. CNPSo 3281]|uniref:MFS transporter n=1 Tax=Paraburkholderia sp. CNPSo 3281 TaxID=2940933 RepID=UPI0020B764A9|nr:MFS transporter [Paraburkholderia sp. CNPSo 3281]MCP3716530.1 MFS transporter [Paraburkholderia sp. CNPSo 3281]